MELDTNLLRVLPFMRHMARTADVEYGAVVYLQKSPGTGVQHKIMRGDTHSVDTWPLELNPPAGFFTTLTAHSHPQALYPDATHFPPSGNDVREYLLSKVGYLKFVRNFVVAPNGVWELVQLTPSAAEELAKVTTFDGKTVRTIGEGEMFFEVAADNAHNNGGHLNLGDVSVEEYIRQMHGLLDEKDMGIDVRFYTYEEIEREHGKLPEYRE